MRDDAVLGRALPLDRGLGPVHAITDTKKGEQGLHLLIFKLPEAWF